MTTSQLQDLIVAILVREYGGSQRRWRMAVGPIRLHDIKSYPHCNWSVAPSGGSRENAQIERLLDTIRLQHPVASE